MLLIIRGNVYKKVYNGTVMNNLMNKMLAVKLLGFEFMKQFTSLLTWVDGASFNQLFLVSVWNSCFQVNIKLFDLLQSIGRVFYIDFCQVRVYLARENHLLQKYSYLWRLIISTLHMHQSIFFLIKICYQ